VNSVSRTRIAVQDRVCVGDKVLDPGVLQIRLDARFVRALGKPYAARLTTEMFFVIGDRDIHLRSACFGRRDQRQEAVCRTARDDLERTFILKLTKCANEISMIAIVPQSECRAQTLGVHSRDVVKFKSFVLSSMDFLIRELEKIFEMTRIAVLQHLVREHFAQRWRDIHRKPGFYTRFVETLENEYERKVNFGDRFEEPVFFKKFRILGMPDKRQVSVKN
jgi:hypothetical protein